MRVGHACVGTNVVSLPQARRVMALSEYEQDILADRAMAAVSSQTSGGAPPTFFRRRTRRDVTRPTLCPEVRSVLSPVAPYRQHPDLKHGGAGSPYQLGQA